MDASLLDQQQQPAPPQPSSPTRRGTSPNRRRGRMTSHEIANLMTNKARTTKNRLSYDSRSWLTTGLCSILFTGGSFVLMPWLLLTLLAAGVAVLHYEAVKYMPPEELDELKVPSEALVMLGAAMSLLLAFRLNVSYQRWWEARELWGDVLHASRSLLTHCLSHAPADGPVREVAGWAVGFAVALKHHLRGDLPDIIVLAAVASPAVRTVPRRTPSAARRLDALRASGPMLDDGGGGGGGGGCGELDGLYQLLTAAQIKHLAGSAHPPLYAVGRLRAAVERAVGGGGGGAAAHAGTLVAAVGAVDMMVRALTGCERILKTPCPPGYVGVLRAVVIIWLALLPFCFAPIVHWAAIPLSSAIAFLVLAVEELAVQIENPFGLDANDLPLESFCLTVQADALRLVDEARDAEGAEGEAARAGSPGSVQVGAAQ